MCGQNLKRTSSAAVWNMVFCEYVVNIVTMNTWLRSVGRSCASMRPRHLCILHVITQRILVADGQFELWCAESVALLVDDVLPHEPIRQWVLSFPFQLRFLFASYPHIMGKVLGIVYRTLASHITKKAGNNKQTAQTGRSH
jgi:hypothetical protein